MATSPRVLPDAPSGGSTSGPPGSAGSQSAAARPDVADVVARLRELVEIGLSQGAEKLAPERDLAETCGASRSVVRRALALLEAEGRVFRLRGRAGGAYLTGTAESVPVPPELFDVRQRKVLRSLHEVKGLPQMLREQGFTSRTTMLSAGLEDVPATIGAALGLPPGGRAVSLLRLRFADDLPLSLERLYVDPARCPGLLDQGPIDSFYEVLRERYDLEVVASDETIECIAAERRVAGLLGVRVGAPLLALRRVSRAADGAPVEASIDLFRTDRTRLQVRTVVGEG